jgi:hypothetical protein
MFSNLIIVWNIDVPIRRIHRTLLFVGADWSKQPRGIIFDERDNSVSFSNKAVTSTIQEMSGDTTFAPALLATMDTACAAFLHGRVLGPTEDTKEGEFIGFWLFITCLIIFTFNYCCCRTQRATR